MGHPAVECCPVPGPSAAAYKGAPAIPIERIGVEMIQINALARTLSLGG